MKVIPTRWKYLYLRNGRPMRTNRTIQIWHTQSLRPAKIKIWGKIIYTRVIRTAVQVYTTVFWWIFIVFLMYVLSKVELLVIILKWVFCQSLSLNWNWAKIALERTISWFSEFLIEQLVPPFNLLKIGFCITNELHDSMQLQIMQ